MERAVLDACVLWSGSQRDFLLSLAEHGGYEAAWSTEGLHEVRRNEETKQLDRGASATDAQQLADNLIGEMRGGFPQAEVTGYEHRDGGYGLPDPKDEHVVAAAEQAGIRTIVTENRKDFPPDRLPARMEIVSARDFAARTMKEDPRPALRAVEQMAARSGRHGPRMSVEDVIDQLEKRYKMTEAAEILRKARGPHEAAVSSVQPSAERTPSQQQRRIERRRGGPRTPHLRGDRAEPRGGHQDRGQGPRTP